ncbi:MAG: hypothetical protein K0Q72_3106 [Armatimonadetes bacterium]|nr:hypothetical protein [Armatimonadota bacterium]
MPHRYTTRILHQLARLEAILRARDASLGLTLLGVDHTGHILPDVVPELAEADLVTLELPTTPVRAYLETGRREEIHVRNIFWQDLLEYYAARPTRYGVFGVNVNPHVRYVRGRFYYRSGVLVNDFEAPAAVIRADEEVAHPLNELGGVGEETVSTAALLSQLPEAARGQLDRHGIAHVSPGENPFGAGRHLVVLTEPPAPMLALADGLAGALNRYAGPSGLGEEVLARLAFVQFIEAFLLPVNDFYLLEQMLRHVVRAAESASPGECLRVTHVAGFAHLEGLRAYLLPGVSARISVTSTGDPRFPLHPAYMVPGFFAREMDQTLSAVSLRGEEFQVDLDAVRALLDRYLVEDSDDAERRVLLRALWTRDVPPPLAPDFHSLADEVPLRPSAGYLEEYATGLDRIVMEYVLAELPLPALREMNERLRRSRRRGILSVLAQELQERGWDYRELRRHPEVGPHARRIDAVREALLSGTEPEATFRAVFVDAAERA